MIEAAGVLFICASTMRRLYVLRNDQKHYGMWGLVGGKKEPFETVLQCVHREVGEEIGLNGLQKIIPLELFVSANKSFVYHTFACVVDVEFVPTLNNEHIGYAWINKEMYPKPLHPGLWATCRLPGFNEKLQTIENQIKVGAVS